MSQWSNQLSRFAAISLSLLCLNAFASESDGLMIHQTGLSAAQKLGVLKVLKDKEDYFVLTKSKLHKVGNHDVSHTLKKMTDEQLAHFLNNGHGTIKADQFTNGEFKLDMHVRGNGGGFLGAAFGVVVGQNLVRAVTYGPIWIIAGLTGPAAPVVGTFLTGCAAPFFEPTALAAGAVAGMAGMGMTGPV